MWLLQVGQATKTFLSGPHTIASVVLLGKKKKDICSINIVFAEFKCCIDITL